LELATVDLGHEGGEGRIEAADAEGREVELAELVLDGVRRVVCGDGIHEPAVDARDERLPVGFGAERRVDLRICVVGSLVPSAVTASSVRKR
jgi:hypothetical protein